MSEDSIKNIEAEIKNLQSDEDIAKPKKKTGYAKYKEENEKLLEAVKNF